MNRRRMLSLLGAAATAPVLPSAALARTSAIPALGTTKGLYAYALAVFHARIRPEISAADLAARLNIRPTAADQLIRRMLDDHYIKPGPRPGTYRSADPFQRQKALQDAQKRPADLLMRHLQQLARDYFAAKNHRAPA